LGTASSVKSGGDDYPCPFKGAIEVITKKWTCQIIAMLGNYRSLRYGEIMERLNGISPRTLAYRLRELESTGLVDRRSCNEIPPRVEYSLTKDGMELRELMRPMMEWAGSRAKS